MERPKPEADGAHRGRRRRHYRSLARKYSIFTGLLLSYVIFVFVAYDIWAGRFDPAKASALIILTALIAGAIARYTNRLLARPLRYLEEGIASVRQGRLEPIRISQTGDEIEFVGESFNAMIQDLAESRGKLEMYKDSLEELVRKRTKALEEVSEKALAASKAKSEFLANMSHELRTPMSGVLGMIDVVLDTEDDPRKRENLLIAKSCANSLLALLNDLLDLSKIEAGKMALEEIPFDLAAMVLDSVKSLEVRAAAKRIALRCRSSPGLPGMVKGDPLRLRQVLINLLSNAVKFTEEGYVELRVSHEKDAPSSPRLIFEVEDSGPGIPPDKLPLIFEQFTQADGSISRRYGGTGLGLTITRRLVEMQGGVITVDSETGRGSLFRVELPCRPVCDEAASTGADDRAAFHDAGGRLVAACDVVPTLALLAAAQAGEPVSAPYAANPGAKAVILVVEDNPVNQKIVAAMLRKHEYRVNIAGHGGEVIEALDRDPAALILMDVQMPTVDGFEATRLLRQCPRWAHIPIVAMTAYAMAGDRERCLRAGMNGYVSKPISRQELIAVVEKYLEEAAELGCADPSSNMAGVVL